MATPAAPNGIDLVAEAGALADLFNDLSQALDDFRLGDIDPPLTADETARLKDEAQALEDRAHYFTAQAIGATLQTIQPDLAKIKELTVAAKTQLAHLNDVAKVIGVATSVLSLGTAIVAGNPGGIFTAADALEQTLTGGSQG